MFRTSVSPRRGRSLRFLFGKEEAMPTYEYECKACGHEFEKFQSITASSIRKCPSCGKLKVRRLLGTGAGVIFRGSGFYETDYKRSSGSKNDSGSSDGSSSGDSGSGKTGSSKSTNKAASSTDD